MIEDHENEKTVDIKEEFDDIDKNLMKLQEQS